MRVLVTSSHDPASLNIKQILVEEHQFIETSDMFDGFPVFVDDNGTYLVTSSRDLIATNHLESQVPAEAYIFCSRHRAESGKPALLVHSTGNLGPEAAFGGDPCSLSVASGSLVSVALKTLAVEKAERNLEEFDVTMEATHHGPTSMDTPLIFVELGSTEEYWQHKEGSRAVAAAALQCAQAPFEESCYIGFGGTHYVSKFNKIVLEKNVRLGHIAPKYALDHITKEIVQKMVERSKERITGAIIDWKGTNQQQRERLLPILQELAIDLFRSKRF